MNGASNFSFFNVLSGVSKTLGVAKEVIPLWQQTKPLINNVRTAYSLIKNVSTTPSNKIIPKQPIKQLPKEKTIIQTNNSPQFFA